MIGFLRALPIFAFSLLSGCSGYLVTEHFEVVNDGTLTKYRVHDWYEEETTGPSIGVYRPPVFGFEWADQVYAVYPVFIRNDTILLGPPLIPFIPTSLEDDGSMILKIRHLSKANRPVEPSTISVVDSATSAIRLEKGHADSVGTIFSAKLPISESKAAFTIALTLSNGSSRNVQFVRRRDRFYSPLFSFNGPNPRPSFERYQNDG